MTMQIVARCDICGLEIYENVLRTQPDFNARTWLLTHIAQEHTPPPMRPEGFPELWVCDLCGARAYERTPGEAMEACRRHLVFAHTGEEWADPRAVTFSRYVPPVATDDEATELRVQHMKRLPFNGRWDLAPQHPVRVDGEVVAWAISEDWAAEITTWRRLAIARAAGLGSPGV